MKPSHFNVVTLLSLVSLVAAAAPPLEAQSSTVFAMPGIPTGAKGVPKAPIVMTISVHDNAGVPWGTIRASENETSRVFRAAGIEIDWQNCHSSNTSGEAEEGKNCVETAFPGHLSVWVVKRSIGLSPEVMGISFLSEDGSGFQADVFYEEIAGLQTKCNANLVTVLGHVVAHEIGHLLLGTNSHTPRGIMLAAWGGPDAATGPIVLWT